MARYGLYSYVLNALIDADKETGLHHVLSEALFRDVESNSLGACRGPPSFRVYQVLNNLLTIPFRVHVDTKLFIYGSEDSGYGDRPKGVPVLDPDIERVEDFRKNGIVPINLNSGLRGVTRL